MFLIGFFGSNIFVMQAIRMITYEMSRLFLPEIKEQMETFA